MPEFVDSLIPFVPLISAVIISVTLIVLLKSYNQSRKVNQANIILKILDSLNEKDELKTLRNLLAQWSPILKRNGGSIEELDLINYFVIFSNLYRFTKMKILDKKLVKEVFGQIIVTLNSHPEVSEYIKLIQEEQGSEVWTAISLLIDQLDLKKQLKEAIDLRESSIKKKKDG